MIWVVGRIWLVWTAVVPGVHVVVSSCRTLGFCCRCLHSILGRSSGRSLEAGDCGACSLGTRSRVVDQQLPMSHVAWEEEEVGDASMEKV